MLCCVLCCAVLGMNDLTDTYGEQVYSGTSLHQSESRCHLRGMCCTARLAMHRPCTALGGRLFLQLLNKVCAGPRPGRRVCCAAAAGVPHLKAAPCEWGGLMMYCSLYR